MHEVLDRPLPSERAAAPAAAAPDRARWILPAVFLLVAGLVAVLHDSMEEWDGAMMLLAGREFWQTGVYTGYPAHFWPPLFPLLGGLLERAGLGLFEAGKLISVVAGTGLVALAYPLARELTGSRAAALWTQAFLAANGLVLVQAASADNNMLDAAFFAAAVLVLLRALRNPGDRRFLAVGALIGLAGLSRYTSYALGPVAALTPFLLLPRRDAFRAAAAVTVAFLAVTAPWWLANWAWHGSPLHTWQWMNIGYGVTHWGTKWFWWDMAGYDGVLDIVREWPRGYARNYLTNLLSFPVIFLGLVGVLLPFAIAAILRAPLDLERGPALVLFGGAALFALLASNAFLVDQYLVAWIAPLTPLAVWYALRLVDRYHERFPRLRRVRAAHLLGVLLLASAVGAFGATREFLAGDDDDNGKLTDIRAIAETLRAHDPAIADKYVMATAPATAYYIGSRYLVLPGHYDGPLDGMLEYRGLPDIVVEYAAKVPARYTREELRADYLIWNESASQRLPQFAFLMDPRHAGVPPHFRPVYVAPRVVVYQIGP